MTRFFRPNGSADARCCAALATWPFFGVTLSAVAGFVLSLAMQSVTANTRAPSGPHRRCLRINLASVPSAAMAPDCFSRLARCILLALPQLRWFLIASMASALVLACALIAWRHHVARVDAGFRGSRRVVRGVDGDM
jgi:hypothetical protein